VVVGHAWTPLRSGSDSVTAAYLWVFSFHMPAFVMIAGYFSKHFDAQPRRIKRLIGGVAVPYVIFECLYTLYANVADDAHLRLSLLDPGWAMWFLTCLFVWRLSAPIWRALRYPLATAFALSILASTGKIGPDLDMDRLLQLLPFFVLGMVVHREHLALLHRPAVRIAAVVVLAAGAVGAYLVAPQHGKATEWLYWRSDRSAFDHLTGWQWLGLRCVVVAVAVAMLASFLALVPRRRMWFTALGAGTMYAYLLHGFVLRTARYVGGYRLDAAHTAAGAIVITLLAIGTAIVLCSSPVRALFRPIVEPDLAWAFRRERAGGSGVRADGAPVRHQRLEPTRHEDVEDARAGV
jgi:fucose 4-O-acetylase-like acetyltransferase